MFDSDLIVVQMLQMFNTCSVDHW